MALVKKYPVKVIAIQNTCEGVYTLELASLTKPFKFEPGQFLHLALDEYDPSAQWPESRCFSIQSSPDEQNIKITYAVKGSFTTRMEKLLSPGSEITLKLPYGDLFSQPHNKNNTVFIAGGTGITPFLSLFNHASFAEYQNPILHVGFRSYSMNLYSNALENAQKINPSFITNLVYQDIDGLLDISKIVQYNSQNTFYFISGPPEMIKCFKQFLLKADIRLNQILTDDWE